MSTSSPIGSIMLIDDNEIDHRMCKRVVERSGLVGEFITFLSAEEALDHLRQAGDRPVVDAILLDVNMPRMDGFEFLETATAELGERFARVVVMMLTTSLNPRDKERAQQFSVVRDYCNKPLIIEYLQRLADILANDPETAK
ncbi:response regulator receiver protein [Ruegeria sp. TM1040]|uniref:response regulator n=1 Tax=Ruegeria sp. (strain TM1040) TaxID=292414 RepID=UPI0000555D25|nr:response regulator [Ruegeria sp. TM1040]ABF63562.1 response regulator receiver protein [Ruegeria sp. TM1040]